MGDRVVVTDYSYDNHVAHNNVTGRLQVMLHSHTNNVTNNEADYIMLRDFADYNVWANNTVCSFPPPSPLRIHTAACSPYPACASSP